MQSNPCTCRESNYIHIWKHKAEVDRCIEYLEYASQVPVDEIAYDTSKPLEHIISVTAIVNWEIDKMVHFSRTVHTSDARKKERQDQAADEKSWKDSIKEKFNKIPARTATGIQHIKKRASGEDEQTHDIQCVIVRETTNAILVEYEHLEHWFPLSTVNSIAKNKHSKQATLNIDHWILAKKGLI